MRRHGGQVLREEFPVFVRDLFANQLADIDPHLFIRLKRLLQLILLRASIVVDREACLDRLGSSVAGGN